MQFALIFLSEKGFLLSHKYWVLVLLSTLLDPKRLRAYSFPNVICYCPQLMLKSINFYYSQVLIVRVWTESYKWEYFSWLNTFSALHNTRVIVECFANNFLFYSLSMYKSAYQKIMQKKNGGVIRVHLLCMILAEVLAGWPAGRHFNNMHFKN